MTKTLRFLLSSKTYLEWTEDETGQRLFWKRLTREIDRPALAPPRAPRDDDDSTVGSEEGAAIHVEPDDDANYVDSSSPLIQVQ